MSGASPKQGYVGNTDLQWFRYLLVLQRETWAASGHGLPEANFWVPSGRRFRALNPGEPFFFRLKSPRDCIAGFGFFAHFSRLPAWLAWDLFGTANGAPDQAAFYTLLARYLSGRDRRPVAPQEAARREIGCIILTQPVFLEEEAWMAQPPDWKGNIVSGKKIGVRGTVYGERLWQACVNALALRGGRGIADMDASPWGGRARGTTSIRLGQGAFRSVLLDAYGRACAVTREHSLPVLEAAHIRPFAETERHEPSNGILLRVDLHRLFDGGYVTVTPDHRFEVSPRLRDEWDNGRTYYELRGRKVFVPRQTSLQPDPEALRWHNEHVFLAA